MHAIVKRILYYHGRKHLGGGICVSSFNDSDCTILSASKRMLPCVLWLLAMHLIGMCYQPALASNRGRRRKKDSQMEGSCR